MTARKVATGCGVRTTGMTKVSHMAGIRFWFDASIRAIVVHGSSSCDEFLDRVRS
jgi:hypothetical protein